jgi:hypothetical protein
MTPTTAPSRRELLHRAAGGFGALALAGLWAETQAAALPADPLTPRPGHFPARADAVIFVFSTGGTSHVDTFDHKPKLFADHGKTVTVPEWQDKKGKFDRHLKRPNWEFKPAAKCGTPVSGLFPELAGVMDEVCVLNAVYGDTTAHDKATLGMHTGSFSFARPSIGSWLSYGLGTVNRNLPSFVVLAPAAPYAGAQNWGNDFLPGCHQGSWVVPGKEPVPHLVPRPATASLQGLEHELRAALNRRHRARAGADAALDARIRAFETAFGMQRQAPEAFALAGETDETLALYGIDRKTTAGFGWQCLTARRLVERGVRFVELIDTGSSSAENWDSHGNMNDHARLAKAIDRPLAALLTDLKRRGLLSRTLVVWTTEFGRTPFNTSAGHAGREHHHQCFSSWLAGGGVKGGLVYGKSDEYGIFPAENKVHVHDFHATILHLMGIDHEKLTYRHAGRDYRLTDVSGTVVKSILA